MNILIWKKVIFGAIENIFNKNREFQSIWNSGGASTIYLNSESLKTLPYYLGLLSSQAGINAAGVSAASSLILFIPNLVIFIVMQSKVMNTMARSGIK